jgi:hypothetical protein
MRLMRHMRLKHFVINEASYHGNIGFTEMCEFYRIASEDQIEEMEKILKKEDWEAFKKLIYKVLRVNLK